MNILNVRVDDRLVHGTVATQWTPRLQIQRVICIDDESANNPMMKSALRLATPKSVFLSAITLDKALENLRADKYGDERCMIVVKNPITILKLVEGGIPIDSLTLGNLGNQKRTADSVTVSRFITINKEDYKTCEALVNKGVKLVAQMAPEDTPGENFFEEIKRKVKEEG